jgi:hypothetical protein
MCPFFFFATLKSWTKGRRYFVLKQNNWLFSEWAKGKFRQNLNIKESLQKWNFICYGQSWLRYMVYLYDVQNSFSIKTRFWFFLCQIGNTFLNYWFFPLTGDKRLSLCSMYSCLTKILCTIKVFCALCWRFQAHDYLRGFSLWYSQVKALIILCLL